jgi:hypothetical protein
MSEHLIAWLMAACNPFIFVANMTTSSPSQALEKALEIINVRTIRLTDRRNGDGSA